MVYGGDCNYDDYVVIISSVVFWLLGLITDLGIFYLEYYLGWFFVYFLFIISKMGWCFS